MPGLGTAQAGGLAQGGTYFFAARYDTLAAAGQTGIDTDTEPLAQAQVLDALRESGSTLVLIEDRNQTGCVLPDGYSLDGYTGDMVKGFWLNQTFRARYQTLGYSGAEEIVNMLYRAVVDRGMTVLWLTPLTDAAARPSRSRRCTHSCCRIWRSGSHRPAISTAPSPASRPKRSAPCC